MYCPNCGNRIEDETAVNCPFCMFQVNQIKYRVDQLKNYEIQKNAQAELNKPNIESSKPKIKLAFVIPAVIIYTLIIGYIIFIYAGSDFSFSTDPMDHFRSSLKSNGFEETETDVFEYNNVETNQIYIVDLNDKYFAIEGEDYIGAYYYIDDYFYYSEKKYLYTVKAGYYISTGEVECETEPATYSSICKSYTSSLRESGISVKESFELLINKLGIEMDDLKEASTND